jgi:chromosome segregation ATPase
MTSDVKRYDFLTAYGPEIPLPKWVEQEKGAMVYYYDYDSLRAERDELQRLFTREGTLNDRLSTHIGELTAELAAVKAERDALKQDVSDKRALLALRNDRLVQLHKEIDDLRGLLIEAHAALESYGSNA